MYSFPARLRPRRRDAVTFHNVDDGLDTTSTSQHCCRRQRMGDGLDGAVKKTCMYATRSAMISISTRMTCCRDGHAMLARDRNSISPRRRFITRHFPDGPMLDDATTIFLRALSWHSLHVRIARNSRYFISRRRSCAADSFSLKSRRQDTADGQLFAYRRRPMTAGMPPLDKLRADTLR